MKLEFESVSELQQFLNWAYGFRPHGAPDPTANRARDPIGPVAAQAAAPDTPGPKIDTAGVAFDTPQSALKGDHVALMDGAQPGGGHVESSGNTLTDAVWPKGAAQEAAGKVPEQPATRKRRTKAEIAADEKVAADLAAAKSQGEGTDNAADAPTGSETAPAGTNPFEQVAAAGEGPAAGAAEGGEKADSAAADTIVTPFMHLTRGREFIAKHGMPKYSETFKLAELDPDVMKYNAEQRAQHMAAMAELDKA